MSKKDISTYFSFPTENLFGESQMLQRLPSPRWFSSGRDCLLLVSKLLGQNTRLFVPEYFCAALKNYLKDFFNDAADNNVVFTKDDVFVKENKEDLSIVNWIVPNSQKHDMEPIIITLLPGGTSYMDDPHEGEEFGFVLAGSVTLYLGNKKYKVKKNESFYYKANHNHYIRNDGKTNATVLWVSTPPNF